MKYRFCIVDVFTESPFGGNQLAVLPDAAGLGDGQMQQIAREFNFSESTFVFPPENPANTRRVRIFTPDSEIPFAGHPNVGTAFALAALGEIPMTGTEPVRVLFEEVAGIVPVRVEHDVGKPGACELRAPRPLVTGPEYPVAQVAEMVSLKPGDIVITTHPPLLASVGLEFLFVEVVSAPALARSRPPCLSQETGASGPIGLHLYTRDRADLEVDLRARMYAPGAGIGEDPATGSANCALAALLAERDSLRDGSFEWSIAQGVEMGRPSLLRARAEKTRGKVEAAYIGGASVMIAEGEIEV